MTTRTMNKLTNKTTFSVAASADKILHSHTFHPQSGIAPVQSTPFMQAVKRCTQRWHWLAAAGLALGLQTAHAQLAYEALMGGSNTAHSASASASRQQPSTPADPQAAAMLGYPAMANPTSASKPMPPSALLTEDHLRNQASDVFGAQLFTGAFSAPGAMQFNPDYAIAIGDQIQVRLWGAFNFEQTLTVDPRGNIFLPHVGPVPVLSVRNNELQTVVQTAVRKAFRNNVSSYATLAAAQPVRVFVGGNVNRPGLYNGTSMDSVLHYLDIAGGVDPERGSYLQVQVKRGEHVKATLNLYDFLLQGTIPMVQLADGDVIFVPANGKRISVKGLVVNAKRFEFKGEQQTVAQLMKLAKPLPLATHVRVVRNTGSLRNVEYYPLTEAEAIALSDGDELEFTADKKPGTITVRVEGEHDSAQEYVLPYGTPMGELLQRIQPRQHSDMQSVQLFRESVKQRQREMLQTSLHNLEMSLLTARSGSSEEARLRTEEADLALQWVERAKKIEPIGQVQIAKASQLDSILLENGDVIRIPRKDDIVLVSGEVLFPNAVAYESNLSLEGYIDRAGGFTQMADNARVVVARRDGSFEQVNPKRLFANTNIQPGDQILVLPKVDEKKRQFWKDMTQILYQIAVSAKVVFGSW